MAAKLMPVMAALQDWLRVGKKFSTVCIMERIRVYCAVLWILSQRRESEEPKLNWPVP
jgi:hypothetical protein